MSELKLTSKLYLEDSLSEVKITKSEEENLERVFNLLLSLENEPSSDENEANKKYLKEIKRRVEEKRKLHFETSLDKSKSSSQKTFSIKAIRKVLRKYLSYDTKGMVSCITNKQQKDDVYLMIWEYDQDLDSSISKQEFENMYRRCIKDEKEKEPKRLYYLVLFMMFDRDEKYYIIEEDTLEILYIRYKERFEEMLNSIFAKANKGEVPVVSNVSIKQLELRKELSYKEFIERMTSISLVKRKEITRKKKNYCNYIHEILKEKGLPIVHIPKKK